MSMAPNPNTPPSAASERRRRSRLHGHTPGWIVPDNGQLNHPWEVRVRDVSRHGVGFESAEQMSSGEVCRIRIGRGPIELARRIRVTRCHPGQNGAYEIGGEFV